MSHPQCDCSYKKNIYRSFLLAQAELDSIEAGAVNGGFKNKYARLVDLYNASKKALRTQGIFISHKARLHKDTQQQLIETALIHAESGEEIVDTRYLLPEKPGSQGLGSAETYMKRYALRSLLGTDVGEDDDDGESERLYLKKLDDFMKLIKKHASDPKKLYEDLLQHFKIDHHYKIGEHRLFEAACWVIDNICNL